MSVGLLIAGLLLLVPGSIAIASPKKVADWNEFSMEYEMQNAASKITYHAKVYNKLDVNGNVDIYEELIEYDSGGQFSYKTKDKTVSGYVTYTGIIRRTKTFSVKECETRVPTNRGIKNARIFPVEDLKTSPSPFTMPIFACNGACTSVASVDFNGNRFMYFSRAGSNPYQALVNRDSTFKITSLNKDGRDWEAPVLDFSLCQRDRNVRVRQGFLQLPRLKSKLHGDLKALVALEEPALIELGTSQKLAAVEQKEVGCKAADKGDGFCDDYCNNEEHDWDGGDCCRGTCQDGPLYVCGSNNWNCRQKPNTTCLFLHGFKSEGPTPPETRPTQCDPQQKYWMEEQELEGLCEPSFLCANTVKNGWTDLELQMAYYNASVKVHASGGVVFAHSMANLLLTAACIQQWGCDIKWFSLGGPIRGAESATWFASISPLVLGQAIKSLHPKHKLISKKIKFPDLLSQTVHKKKMYLGQVCGVSALGSGGSSNLARLGRLLSGVNDGAVIESECRSYRPDEKSQVFADIFPSGLSPDRKHKGFLYQGNHEDETGRNGNVGGILDWYRDAIRGKLE